MKNFSALLLLIAGMFAISGHAQNWVAYTPAEGDFRVLFPAPPERLTAPDGSVSFKATLDDNDNSGEYIVHRLPYNFGHVTDAQATIFQRLLSRVGDGADLRFVRDKDDDPEWARYVFRYRYSVSIHRLVENRGRYYDLEVVMPVGQTRVAMLRARGFFDSFQITGVPLSIAGFGLGQRMETWCQNRSDPFSRVFCEYTVCLQPGHDKHPRCNFLFGR